MATATNTKPRAALSDVTLSFNLVSFTVDLIPATISKTVKKESFTSVCPTCTEPHKVKQQYVCSFDPSHGPFAQNEVAKAIPTDDGGLRRCTADEVASVAKAATKTTAVALSVYAAGQVESATLPSGGVYRLKLRNPSKATEEAYTLLAELAQDSKLAFVCEVTMRSVERMFRMTAAGGVLTLVELARPEDIYAIEAVSAPITDKHRKMGALLVETMVEDFDPETWAGKRAARIEALRATEPGAEPTPITQSAKDTVDDLMSLLEQSLAA